MDQIPQADLSLYARQFRRSGHPLGRRTRTDAVPEKRPDPETGPGLYDYPKTDLSSVRYSHLRMTSPMPWCGPGWHPLAALLVVCGQSPGTLCTSAHEGRVFYGRRYGYSPGRQAPDHPEKHHTPQYGHRAIAGRSSGLVIQALRHVGRKNVDQQIIAQLDRRLEKYARKQLLQDIRYAPVWIAAYENRQGEIFYGEAPAFEDVLAVAGDFQDKLNAGEC